MNTMNAQDLEIIVEQCRLFLADECVEVVLGCTYRTSYVSVRELCPFYKDNKEEDYVKEAVRRSKSTILQWMKQVQKQESIVGSIVTLDATFFQESEEDEKENKRSRDTFEMEQVHI